MGGLSQDSNELHQVAIDAYDEYWTSIHNLTPDFKYFRMIEIGMITLVLYAPDTKETFKEAHRRIFNTETQYDGPALSVFAGMKEWSKEEFLKKAKYYIILPVCMVCGKVVIHENCLSHELLHVADWYAEMVGDLDFAHPHDLNKEEFYQ